MSKETLFSNKYILTDKLLKEFVSTSTKGTRLVGYFIAGMSVFFAYSEFKRNSLMFGISLVIMAIVAIVYSLILPSITFKNMVKDDEIYKDINKEVTIDIEYNIIILRVNESKKRIFYSDIISILENKDYFYLMTNRNEGIILGKNNFTDGTSEEFRKFIQTKFVRPKSAGG